MKKLFFIRHGESQWNLERRFAGRHDTPLTEKGRAQALAAAKKAKSEDLSFDLIVSSPLSRALDTAKIIAEELGYPEAKIEVNPLLAERDYGSLTGKFWAPDIDMDGIADIETVDDLRSRAAEVADWLRQIPQDTVLIVGHGSLGNAIRHDILSRRPEEFTPAEEENDIPNAEIIRWL